MAPHVNQVNVFFSMSTDIGSLLVPMSILFAVDLP